MELWGHSRQWGPVTKPLVKLMTFLFDATVIVFHKIIYFLICSFSDILKIIKNT